MTTLIHKRLSVRLKFSHRALSGTLYVFEIFRLARNRAWWYIYGVIHRIAHNYGGAALSKWKIIERAKEFKGRLGILALFTLAAGIWIKLLPHLKKPTLDLIQLQDTIGNVILAAGYVSLLLLLCTVPFELCLDPLVSGSMYLTTYLTQSVVATLIFYSYGFGLYGKVDLAAGTWIAIGVFAVQVILAELWLSKFRMGPIEWLWRKGTYERNLTKKEE